MSRIILASSLVFACIAALPIAARAGVPECGGIRIEAGAACAIEFSCSAGCEAEVYQKNCATRLYRTCHQECETPPSVICTDDCGAFCDSECARGVDVICQHNCFPECVDSCEMTCASYPDPEQCRASCAATCDGECTAQCSELPPDTSCVQHCEECCTGSCRAIAGMDCQVSCQESEFEVCETEVDVDCHAGCEGSGALFCDGQFIAGPEELLQCARGLAKVGIETQGYDIDLDAVIENVEASVDVEAVVESVEKANQRGNEGCALAPGALRSSNAALAWLLASLGLLVTRRHRSGDMRV